MLNINSQGRDQPAGEGNYMVRIGVPPAVCAEVGVRAGALLLDGLLGGGVPFSYACQAGMCGECRCLLVSGEVEELPCSPAALGDGDRARGIILACRARVLSDLLIRSIPARECVEARADSMLPVAVKACREEVRGG